MDRGQVRGYNFLHHAVDYHSRFVYSEILPDESKETASAFMGNAIAAFTARGIKIQRVLTDNGSCYRSRSRSRAAVLAESGIRHKRTRPYRPQTNGKVERFNRIFQRNGLTRGPTAQEPNAKPVIRTSSSTTISAGPTPHSRASHRQPRYQPTGLGTAPGFVDSLT